MEHQTVIRSRAVPGAGKPAGAVTSAFNIGGQAKPARQQVRIDPDAVKIERGLPMPETQRVKQSPWPLVYARMKKGDMVRLTSKQAVSFCSWGKKAKAALTRRLLGPDSAGVWRTE